MAPKFDPSLIPAAPDLSLENALWANGVAPIAGIDEAGRGAWAGPVTAAAVIFPPGYLPQNLLRLVRDSKQLRPAMRKLLEPLIKELALAWAVGFASNDEIDVYGILPATRLAMTRALETLSLVPGHLLIDALFLPEIPIVQTALVKGDQRSLSIAAASILAKTARDGWMEELSLSEPVYAFERNKGYGTRVHQQALHRFGPCAVHRFSFAPIKGYQ